MLRPEILLVVGNGEFTGHFALLYHPFLLLEDSDLLSLLFYIINFEIEVNSLT